MNQVLFSSLTDPPKSALVADFGLRGAIRAEAF
jgi:hypothetical protein